jgi:alkylated DNA repair dioxygenase AlkB
MSPIEYHADWLSEPDRFEYLWNNLEWERREDAPRRECWMNDFDRPYTYGRGAGVRTYIPVAWNDMAVEIQRKIESDFGYKLEGCFANGYEGPRDHLGWHADDSPEIDQYRPIAVVSFGSSREIWFRENGSTVIDKQLLGNGSLLLMLPGMQLTHQHRIPKHSANCGARISLTYRGLIKKS